MNIAILFSGNIRSFEQCKETFKKEFAHLNADYYVTTYETKYNFREPELSKVKNVYPSFNNDEFLSDDDIRNIVSDFTPKFILVDKISEMLDIFNLEKEKFDSRIINNGTNDKIQSNHFLQFYKLKKALDLISDYELLLNKKYDVIIRTRMDLLIKNINTLDLSNMNKKVIVGYEDITRFANANSAQHAWGDMLMISSFDNMKKIVDNILSEFYMTTIEKSVWGFPHGIFESGIIKTQLEVDNRNIIHHIKRYGDVIALVT
jgi:hypothetical protein